MMHYIIQTVVFQLLFLVAYDLFLKRSTFYNWNRFYLLLTPVFSLVLPFIQIERIPAYLPNTQFVQLPAIYLSASEFEYFTPSGLSIANILMVIWISGLLLSFGLLISKMIKLSRIKRQSVRQQDSKYNLRIIPNSTVAFSFFNTVYLGDNLSDTQQKHIVKHELIHVKQRHSWDLYFFELLKVIFWYNPLVYVLQHRLSTLHEYIADSKVAAENGNSNYYQELLGQVFQTENISFINTFFNHSLIKNRILMLQKSKSKKTVKLRYLIVLPLLAAMIVYASCAQETDSKEESPANEFVRSTESEITDQIKALETAISERGSATEEEKLMLEKLYSKFSANGENYEFKGVPFAQIDQVPVYPGCEGLGAEDAKKCFTQKVAQFVVANFNSKGYANSEISGRQRIAVKFTISEDGTINDVKAKSEHMELVQEAERVVNMLPKMEPGIHEGKKVNVQFALPIVFELAD